jgi:hypothetical protein
MPGHYNKPTPPPPPAPPQRGSDRHGGGANIHDKPPSFSSNPRYTRAVEIWEKGQGDGAALDKPPKKKKK